MMEITIWGARGSIPVSGSAFQGYGGATTCLEVVPQGGREATPERIVIDCGTGLASLGRDWGDRTSEALVLQTHMHWDHIQGLPFFGPLYDGGTQLSFWSVPREGRRLEEILTGQMQRPAFPVELDEIPASLWFREIQPEGWATLGDLTIRWREVCHPSGATAYRLEHRGATFVFTGDVELQAEDRKALVQFCEGVDLIVMDAQYFPEEYEARRGFGHSTPVDAVSLAREAGVSALLLTHHDPSHDDRRLEEKLRLARKSASGEVDVHNARDGLRVQLSGGEIAITEPKLSGTQEGADA